MSIVRRILIWIAAAIGAAVGVLVLMHAFISPVNPKQDAPELHVDKACWACHIVTDSVDVKDLEEEGS